MSSAPPPSVYATRRCTAADCRLRYPAPLAEPRGGRCPRCGGPTTVESTTRPRDAAPAEPARPANFAALVDNVRSAFNVGSILRTAEGVGLRHVHLCGIAPPAENPKVAKTALGAQHRVPTSHHPDAVELADSLLAAGAELWALEVAAGSTSLFAAPAPTDATVLVVGHELVGIDPALRERCARTLHIGMAGAKSSFNVAVAFGIAAAVLHERRHAAATAAWPTLAR